MRKTILLVVHVFWIMMTKAASLPANFTEKRLAQNLNATGVLVLSDDRILITDKVGKVWLIKGEANPTLFLTFDNVEASGERGLQAVVEDPDFATNQFLYFYYTYKNPATQEINNRVVRYKANGDVADASSFTLLLELPKLTATNHNGGGLVFGNDGKLYISTGENAVPNNSQNQNHLLGKILRINKDGSIPTDNPFYATNTGDNRAVYAIGLRNPFKIKKHPVTGRIFINDVGQNTWEEIDTLRKAGNYGWPTIEGKRTNQTAPNNYSDPLYTYESNNGPCSITGGTFYAPATVSFPTQYVDKYFFQDYCAGNISYINPTSPNTATVFATGLSGAVDLDVDSKGNLYYLQRGGPSGELWKVSYQGVSTVTITLQPASTSVSTGDSVTFKVKAIGSGTLTYQWRRNDVPIPNATKDTFTIDSASLTDNGAKFTVFVSNGTTNQTSNVATLTVIKNEPPVATINTPTNGAFYEAGTLLNFSGTATDPEDGTLPASAFTWKIDFHHDTHVHPGMDATNGVKTGSMLIPNEGEVSTNVWYRIYLTVTDSKGTTTTVQKDISPVIGTLTLLTIPQGLPILLDGAEVNTAHSVKSVVGMKRFIEAPAAAQSGSTLYTFKDWSNGGDRVQTVVAIATGSLTYTANYQIVTGLSEPNAYEQDFHLSPNPASAIVHLKSPEPIDNARIIDMDGHLVKEFFTLPAEAYLPLDGLDAGIYYLQIQSGSNKRVKKLIVQ